VGGQFLDQDKTKSKAMLFVFFAIELLKGSNLTDFLRPKTLTLVGNGHSPVGIQFQIYRSSLTGKLAGIVDQFLDDAS
jgi:hypothetical protein